MRLHLSALAILASATVAACGSTVDSNDNGGTTSGQNTGGSDVATTATTGSAGGGGQGGSGAGPIDMNYPAKHPGFPQITYNGGAVLSDPVVVTVNWPDDPWQSMAQTFDDSIGTFDWWSSWAPDYGVHAATGGGHVTLTDAAPATMSDGDVQQWLDSKIQDGTMPAPTAQTVYALWIPQATTITIPADEGGGSSCSAFLGYHSSFTTTFNGAKVPIAYAIINRCSGSQDDITNTASHELAEAATDPHPLSGGLAYMLLANSPWTLAGGEVGDMCSEVSPVTEKGYSLTRVWSNSSAAKGNQPCVPVPPDPENLPFYDAGLESDSLRAAPGNSVTTTVDCYSFGPLPSPMQLQAQPYSPQSITVTFDQPTCNNGDKVKMTVAVAAGTQVNQDFHFDVYAMIDQMDGHIWRGMVHTTNF